MTVETDYMLNHNAHEWERLERQHEVWRHTLLDALPTLGIGPGSRVLEVGCGSGILLKDLADAVGSDGQIVGLERDPDAVENARRLLAEKPWVEVRQGDLYTLETGDLGEPFDLVVARWVIAWLPDQQEAVRRSLTQLAPDGSLLVQDYNYDGIRMAPSVPALENLFVVMPKAYAFHGGDAWCAAHMPQVFHQAGLTDVEVQPHCLAGDSDSGVFRWAERFFRDYVQKLVDDELLTDKERIEVLEGWDTARATPGSVFFSPMVVNVIGRRSSS